MSYLLAACLLLLILITLTLFRNLVTFDGLAESSPDDRQNKSVAVCIPARNEERNIERCVNSLTGQDYPHLKIFVLDDQSTDSTWEVLQKLRAKAPEKLEVISGAPKPGNWHGKPWACHQLSQKAQADLLIFVDADTWFEPQAISRTVSIFENGEYDFITVWPAQELNTFWEKMLIPLVYYFLTGFLPSDYLRTTPSWIPARFKEKADYFFSAACGQFIAFTQKAYQAIGGHQSVQAEIVEDVALARLIKQKGFKMNMYHGLDTVNCRMYRNHTEITEGFRKNFLAGFEYNIPLFLMAGLLHTLLYLLPFVTLFWGYYHQLEVMTGLSAIAISLILLHRLILSFWFRWDAGYSLLHPVAVLWFQLLGLLTVWDRLTGNPPKWKGRELK